MQEIQIMKITTGKWLVTVSNLQIGTTSCQNSKNNIPLVGSYLIEASTDCKIRIKSNILETYKTSRLTFSKVSLPTLNLSLMKNSSPTVFIPPLMELNQINLKTTQEIEAKIQEQKKTLQEVTSTIYVKRTSFWTIFLYVIFILILIMFVYRKLKKSKKIPNNQTINTNDESVF
jgi:cbb3-type cytochrome oxidase subunit 3